MKTLRRIFLISLVMLFFTGFTSGQQENFTPVPIDSNIRFGKLDNGLTYYILANKEPEKRASFYLIQNVGSLLEEDKQNGLAHFLEHMAFNGTRHFPGKGIISFLEKHGVAFGRNINAYTYYYETVYNLSDVPVDPPGLLDSCLLVLNDWSDYLLLSEEEIDAERGVIVEEWRTRRTSASRMMEQYLPVLLKGSKYPERDIIGDMEIIKSFDYQTLRDYYNKWYRTDLQAVAIVGDFNADEMEEKVRSLFSKIPALDNPEPIPAYNIPEHNETLYVLATDKEATQHSVDLYIKHKAVEPSQKGINYLREQYIRTLFNSMISARINELVQKGVPPFVTGSVNYSSFLRGYDVFSLGVTCRQNEDSLAFDAIYREAERVKRYGFTEGELLRAKDKILTNWDSYYKQKDKIDNDTYASNIQSHFLINEPLASIDFEYNTIKEIIPVISLEEVSEKAKEWMTDKNRVILVQGPEAVGETYLTEEQAHQIISNISEGQLEPYNDKSTGEKLINTELEGSKIISTLNLDNFDATEWTLENGVKVIFKHADFEKDNVSLMAFSKGGLSLVENAEIPSAQMMAGLVAAYGAGDFDNVALQKFLSGKKVSVNFSLADLTENISASATPSDLETMFQLVYLKFEKPRFDEEAHNALISRYKALISQLNNNPQKIMQDSISVILTDYHPRTRIFDSKFIDEVNFKDIEKIYNERFADADDFTFIIVGNVDKESLKPLVEKYLGSLTSIEGSEEWIDWKINTPEGQNNKIIGLEMAVPKATVLVHFSRALEYNAFNRQALRAINGILTLRYDETIREEEGGTYGVSATISLEQFPEGKGSANILFECEPERAEELKAIIHKEIKKLCEEGPSETDLSKTKNNILKVREESKNHNSYWMSGLYSYYFSKIDYNDPANFEDIVKSLTPDDIRKAAVKLFNNAENIDIVFSPAETKE